MIVIVIVIVIAVVIVKSGTSNRDNCSDNYVACENI